MQKRIMCISIKKKIQSDALSLQCDNLTFKKHMVLKKIPEKLN